MPYLDQILPFSGSSPQPKHASFAGAQDAKARALTQVVRYLKLLKDRPDFGLTDMESARLMGVERSTINARRATLVKADLVYADGFRDGESGVKNCVWKAR